MGYLGKLMFPQWHGLGVCQCVNRLLKLQENVVFDGNDDNGLAETVVDDVDDDVDDDDEAKEEELDNGIHILYTYFLQHGYFLPLKRSLFSHVDLKHCPWKINIIRDLL